MKNFIKKYWIYAVLFLIGYLIGKYAFNKVEIKTVEVVKLVPSPYPAYDTIFVPIPELIKPKPTPSNPNPKPVKPEKPEPPVSDKDTLGIINDYWLTRFYKLDFSNDTLGTYIVDAEVSQNRIIIATSKIQPKIKVIERETVVYKVPMLQFYVMGGSSVDFKINKLQAGIDFNQKYLLGVSGIRIESNYIGEDNNIISNSKYNYTIDFGIKF